MCPLCTASAKDHKLWTKQSSLLKTLPSGRAAAHTKNLTLDFSEMDLYAQPMTLALLSLQTLGILYPVNKGRREAVGHGWSSKKTPEGSGS